MQGALSQIPINSALFTSTNGEHFVTRSPERSYHERITALISEKAHATGYLLCHQFNDALMRQSVGGVRKYRSQILDTQARIGVK